MRSAALLRYIHQLKPADYKTITLDRSGKFWASPRNVETSP
jgi:hypothetical protein